MTVAADSRWRLREGTRLDRIADLDEELRCRLTGEGEKPPAPEAGVLSRRRGRTAPVLLDPDAAELLAQFGDGKSVAQAVLDLARIRDADPYELLEASFPAVERLVGKGYLVDADAPPSVLGYRVGDLLGSGRWRIVQVISRLEDSEVHLVRGQEGCRAHTYTWGVVKLSTAERRVGRPEHEAEILRYAARQAVQPNGPASVVPELLDEGAEEADGEEQRWIVVELVRGVPVHLFARGLRRLDSSGSSRQNLAALCVASARAFVDLHQLGVVHGDVHPDNLLALGPDHAPRVRLIDLGCSRRLGDGLESSSRPGIDIYREPEVAAAIRARNRPPAVSRAGEQYALAALLFQLLTGHDYLDFSADRDELLRQVAEEPPRCFEDLGAEAWPEMEAVLRRALHKDRAARFESMDALAEALEAVVRDLRPGLATSEGSTRRRVKRTSGSSTALERAGEQALRRAEPEGEWWTQRTDRRLPTSLFFGSAGLGWGLLQAALRRGDAELLAQADLWANCALRGALERDLPEISWDLPKLATAPCHSRAGVHETAACVAWARGDLRMFALQGRSFLEASKETDDSELRSESAELELDVDLTLGRPGSLISAAHLLARARPPHPDGRDEQTPGGPKDRFGLGELAGELKSYGCELLDDLWGRLDQRPRIDSDDAWMGMAHGWAGALYATLVWCRAAERLLPTGVETRLEELAAEAIPHRRGMRWTRKRLMRGRNDGGEHVFSGQDSMAGWCHGSAGYVLLFNAAASRPGLTRFRDTAEAAAWDVWDRFVVSRRPVSHLCCGLVGQAWSLLIHARESGDESWIHRAAAMAESAAARRVFDRRSDEAPGIFDGALFKGEGSLPALLADLEVPKQATWPWLEDVELPFA